MAKSTLRKKTKAGNIGERGEAGADERWRMLEGSSMDLFPRGERGTRGWWWHVHATVLIHTQVLHHLWRRGWARGPGWSLTLCSSSLQCRSTNSPSGLGLHRLAEWVQKQDMYICSLQETHFRSSDIYRLKVRGMEKGIPCKWKSKES